MLGLVLVVILGATMLACAALAGFVVGVALPVDGGYTAR
jgi:hypothetical protein